MTTTPSFQQTAAAWSLATAALCWTIGAGAALAADGATGANAKIQTGGASTLQSGRTISITRGVNLDNADFSGQNLKGVAFQQSIVRDADFRKANLTGASFFDATLDGSDFENAYVPCCRDDDVYDDECVIREPVVNNERAKSA